MYRIFRATAASLVVLALAGCNVTTDDTAATNEVIDNTQTDNDVLNDLVTDNDPLSDTDNAVINDPLTNVAELSKPPTELKIEDINTGDIKLIALTDDGFNDFVVTSNEIEAVPGSSGPNMLSLTSASDAANYWDLFKVAIEALELAYEYDLCEVDPQTGNIDYCELGDDASAMYIESDLANIEDANGNYSRTGSFWVGIEDEETDYFIVIGLDNIINDGVLANIGETESISFDLLMMMKSDEVIMEGWVTVETFDPFLYPIDSSTGEIADEAITGTLSMTDEAGNTYYYLEYLEDNNWVTYDELGAIDDTPDTGELNPVDIKLIAQADAGLKDFLVTSNGIEVGGSGTNTVSLTDESDAEDLWEMAEIGFALQDLADEEDSCEVDPNTSYITYCELILDGETIYFESEMDYVEDASGNSSLTGSIWFGSQDPADSDFFVVGLDNILIESNTDDFREISDVSMDILTIEKYGAQTYGGWVEVETIGEFYYPADPSTGVIADDAISGTLTMTDADYAYYIYEAYLDDNYWVGTDEWLGE